MKQYFIRMRTMGYETQSGSVFGDNYEVSDLCKNVRKINIMRNDKMIYGCVCDNVEIVEESDDRTTIYIYNTAIKY